MTAQPDVEIYVKRATTEAVLAWLSGNFTVVDQAEAGEMLKVRLEYEGRQLTCSIVEKAVKGGYMSILFEPNNTPWGTDEQCAEAAFRHFDLEVRCSTGSWENDSEDTGGWYRYTAQGKSIVNWLA